MAGLQLHSSIFFVSARFKALIEQIVPGYCDYRPCVSSDKKGRPGPEYWVCSVTKAFRGAVDTEKTDVVYNNRGGFNFKNWDTKISFKGDVISGAHLFRISERAGSVYCDEVFARACKATKIAGLHFHPHCAATEPNSMEA